MRILAIIPAFNEEDCLAETVAELRQACPDVDYLIIDDGSSDATRDVMREHNLNGVSHGSGVSLSDGHEVCPS